MVLEDADDETKPVKKRRSSQFEDIKENLNLNLPKDLNNYLKDGSDYENPKDGDGQDDGKFIINFIVMFFN